MPYPYPDSNGYLLVFGGDPATFDLTSDHAHDGDLMLLFLVTDGTPDMLGSDDPRLAEMARGDFTDPYSATATQQRSWALFAGYVTDRDEPLTYRLMDDGDVNGNHYGSMVFYSGMEYRPTDVLVRPWGDSAAMPSPAEGLYAGFWHRSWYPTHNAELPLVAEPWWVYTDAYRADGLQGNTRYLNKMAPEAATESVSFADITSGDPPVNWLWAGVGVVATSAGIDPPLRLYPHRGDGLGADNARRLHPPPSSFQGGLRRGWRGGHL